MLTSYQASIDDSDLHSLIFDADELRSYLSTNNNSIKKVKVMFAHTLPYINSGHEGQYAGYKAGELTVIIAGYDLDNNYVYWNTNNVMDNALPCPTMCPVNGTASNNVFE